MKRAVLMSRVSSDEQALGYSLGVQKESLEKYCERNNIEVAYHFSEDHSAKNFERPAYNEFLKYIKSHKNEIDLLLFTSWDRFSRNITDALVMIRNLSSLGITAQAIEQPIDLTVPENKAMLALYLVMPEVDNDRRSIKIRGGMRAGLKAGRWLRMAPKGYSNKRDDNNKPIIVPSNDVVFIKYIIDEVLKEFEPLLPGVKTTEGNIYKLKTMWKKRTYSTLAHIVGTDALSFEEEKLIL